MAIVDPPMVNRQMLVPENNVFIGAQPGSALVLHKTASGTSAEQIANFFINDPGKKSAHFVIGQDGQLSNASILLTARARIVALKLGMIHTGLHCYRSLAISTVAQYQSSTSIQLVIIQLT